MKNEELAQAVTDLSQALYFIKTTCTKTDHKCENCVFHSGGDCVITNRSPDNWNVDYILYNMGKNVGRREHEQSANIQE